MKREFSAGGIVYFNFPDGVKFLLINNKAMRDPTKSYWGFPKGHIDPGEKSIDAARREVLEETGVDVDIKEKVGEGTYVFTWEGEKIFKMVIIFLMEAKTTEIKIQQEEIEMAEWFSQEEVLSKLSFSKDKELFKKSLEIMNG